MTADTAASAITAEKSSEVQIQNGGDIEAEKDMSANGGIFKEVS